MTPECPDPALVFRDFLPSAFHARVRAMAHGANDTLVQSRVIGDAPSYRKSRIMARPESEAEAGCLNEFARLIDAFLPTQLSLLDVPVFERTGLELQFTVSGDGDYFLPHIDNGGELAARQVTFIYYLVNTPGCFTGGELRVFRFKEAGDMRRPTSLGAQTIMPEDNMLVMFPSHYLHRVMRVSVPSACFADSRFTLNGWMLGRV